LIVQGSFNLVLQVYIYCAFIKLASFPHYFLIVYHHAPLIFNSLLYSVLYHVIFICRWVISIFFIL
jgi:hypothetical protein